jgi:hypothetical protein
MRISKREMLSKHALSAGLGVGSLALLAQRASADTPFTSFPFTAIGAPTPRTMPDRLGEIKNVKDYGAVGDGATDDTTSIQNALDAAFGTAAAPHGQSTDLNKAVFFPVGTYKVSGNPALKVTGVKGGLIFGAGMYSSIIQSTDANSVLFWLNGFGFSCIRDLGLVSLGAGSCVALDYDWSGPPNPQGSQNSSFINCVIISQGATATGVRCGNSNWQTDTSSFINCYITGGQYGLKTMNLNALSISVFGGQIAGGADMDAGIYVAGGSVPTIHGVYFTRQPNSSSAYDIVIQGGAGEGYSIAGCRSESQNFCHVYNTAIIVHIQGCLHAGGGVGALGHFVRGGTNINLTSCWSNLGDVYTSGGGSDLASIRIDDCVFNRFDALNLGGNNASAYIKNSTFGDIRTGMGRFILNQSKFLGALRTYDIESSDITSDGRFLYDNYLDPTAQNGIANGVPTTQGISVTFTVASPTVVTFPAAHNFQGGEPVAFSAIGVGTLPTGISANTTYFVTNDGLVGPPGSFSTCHLSDTQANALAGTANINVTVAGSGDFNTWSVRKYAVGDRVLNVGVAAGGSPGWICTTAGWAAAVNAGETKAVFKPFANIGA